MILDEIVATSRKSLARRRSRLPLAEIERLLASQPPPRDFVAALRGQGMKLIAEVKRASPSRGLLHPDLDALSLGRTYGESAAAAISVLTEEDHFKGSLADLRAIREAVDLPLLRKDFIISPYQVYEARLYGADAVLLIAAILSQGEMVNLLEVTHSLGMEALIEVHNGEEASSILELGHRLVGINNRNLADFTVDLETTLRLGPLFPAETVTVSESGILTREHVLRLEQAGVDAILVGEALVTSPDPQAKIRELLGRDG